MQIEVTPTELDALIATVATRRNDLDLRLGRRMSKALRAATQDELTFLTALQAKLARQAVTAPQPPKTIIAIRETSPGVWRLTYDGAIRGDSRGYDQRGALEEARRMVACDPDYRVLAHALRA